MHAPLTDPRHVTVARWISVIGHPFLLMSLLTCLIAYRLLPRQEALIAELVALGVVIIPAALYTLVKVRRGAWNNLDVSDQKHRGQFYGMLIALLTALTIISWIAAVPRSIALGTTAILAMVSIASILNTTIKVSLHTGFSLFVACVLWLMQPAVAILALALAVAVGWSRVALRRHTVREVMLGGALGLIVGGSFVITQISLSQGTP